MVKNRNLRVAITFLLITIFGLLLYANAIDFSSSNSDGETLAEKKMPAIKTVSTN